MTLSAERPDDGPPERPRTPLVIELLDDAGPGGLTLREINLAVGPEEAVDAQVHPLLERDLIARAGRTITLTDAGVEYVRTLRSLDRR